MDHPRRLRALVITGAAVAAAAALAPPALATTALPGTPLSVFVGDHGQLQGRLAGSADGIFYDPSANDGDAGFVLAFPGTGGGQQAQDPDLQGNAYGFRGSAGNLNDSGLVEYEPRGADAPTGTGAPADPYTQVTRYAIADPGDATNPDADRVLVKQTTKYVNGTQTFDVSWDVENKTTQPLPFKALAAADFYFEGSDVGTGIFTQGPPRFIGGTNADTGRSGGFIETPGATPTWSHYQALAYRSDDGPIPVWQRVGESASSTAPSFDDSVNGQPVDNAGGVEWDQGIDEPLGAGQTRTFSLTVRTALPAALAFSQSNAGAPQGVPISFVVTAKDTSGTPFTGKLLRYTIGGANPGAGAVAIDGAGNAVVTDPGTNAGPDTVIAYVDLNSNGVREPNEPQGSALATFVDQVPPTCTVAVSGDRVRAGSRSKPLKIVVTCNSVATVLTTTKYKIQPKKKKGKKKPKAVTLSSAPTSVAVQPGVADPLSVKVPSSLSKKYGGLKAKATVTVVATDPAGNAQTFVDTQSVPILKPYKKAKRRR